MTRKSTLVNNPLEEGSERFREIFYGKKTTASVEKKQESPAVLEEDFRKETGNETVLVQRPSATKKVLERRNFKVYNTEMEKLKQIKKRLKETRGDGVKADMSSILRFLIEDADIDAMVRKFPERP